ncbi:MAG: hypothetical protein LBG07_10960 [Treponema sp.]|nr:hypothetical protein [Treponema sp.]
MIGVYVFAAFVPAQTCGLGRARPASAKAEAHFSIWGHTMALCGAAFVDIQPAGRMPAVIGVYVFAKQKRKAKTWHGCHVLAAQGIETEIPEALPQVKLRNWSGKPGFCVRRTQKCAHKQTKKVNAALSWFCFSLTKRFQTIKIQKLSVNG